MNIIDKLTERQIRTITEFKCDLGKVSGSLIDKEALISVLYNNILHKRIVYGTMQTQVEVVNYLDGFIDCMEAIKKH